MNDNLSDPVVIEAWQEAVREEVRTRPWFAALLLQKGSGLFDRFVWFYRRLTAVGQRQHRRLALGIGTAALALALSQTPAHAATITVGGGCNLVQAIQSANTNAAVGSCTAGSGADTIVLAGGTYSYDTAYDLPTSATALPTISSVITIEGNGATIARVAGSPDFRLLRVSGSGNLTLNNSTVTGGKTTVGGGISVNYGTLTLNNSTVSGNEATSNAGGIYTRGSNSVTLNNSTVSGNTAANGGGIFIPPGWSMTVTLNNSTITRNQTTHLGGGGILQRSSTITLNRSIVSGNSGPSNQEIWVQGGTMTADNFNLFGHSGLTNAQAFYGFVPGATDRTATSGGTTSTALDSILSTTLADNGGLTLTHALVLGSPAVDFIPAANCAVAPINGVDQRGAVRAGQIVLGDERGGLLCDAGAVEFDSNFTPTAVTNLATQTTTPNQAPLIPLLATLLTLLSGALLWLRRTPSP